MYKNRSAFLIEIGVIGVICGCHCNFFSVSLPELAAVGMLIA
jgi:hypothetical protein